MGNVDFVDIGVASGKFLGVQKIFARISPNLPEKILCDFCLQISSHKDREDFFWYDLQKRSSRVFLQTLGAILWKQTTLGATVVWIFREFAQIFRYFARIFRYFARIFRDFAQIFDKSKLLEVCLHPLHPLHPRLLHRKRRQS